MSQFDLTSEQLIMCEKETLISMIEELKEVNERLKEFAMKAHNFAYGTEFNDPDIVDSFDFDGLLDKLEDECEDDFWKEE